MSESSGEPNTEGCCSTLDTDFARDGCGTGGGREGVSKNNALIKLI